MSAHTGADFVEQIFLVLDVGNHAQTGVDFIHHVAHGIVGRVMGIHRVVIEPGREAVLGLNNAGGIGLAFGYEYVNAL